MMRRFLIGCALLGVASIGNAATVYTWTFTGADVDLGHTSSFTSNGVAITASGFTSNGVAGDLYGKNNGGNEIGLGMNADPTGDHEIYFGTDFIQLDLTNVLAQNIGSLLISMNSTTDGESWRVYDTSSAGTLVGATDLLDGSDQGTHSISPTLRYLDIAVTGPSPDGNVLLHQLTGTSSVPEPGSVALVLLGLGLVGARWTKSRWQN